MKPGEFIQAIAPGAVKAARKYDVPASLLIAHAIIEGANKYGEKGESVLAKTYKNLGGMKATGAKIPGVWDGKSIALKTGEYTKDGQKYEILDEFRVYNSWAQSLEDIAHRYAKRFKLTLDKVGGDFGRFLADAQMSEAMKTGYATNPAYAKMISDTISKYNLRQFDKVVAFSPPSETVTVTAPFKKKIGSEETKSRYWSQAA